MEILADDLWYSFAVDSVYLQFPIFDSHVGVILRECRYCSPPVINNNMGKNYCAVKDCHSVSGRVGRFGKQVKLHKLPKKEHLRTAWLRAISRKHFNPKRTQVCSDHFPGGNGRTWNNQVPTLFLPHKTVKSVKVRQSKNSNKMSIESPAQAVDVNDHSYSVHQIVKGPSPQHPNLDIPTESKASKDILPSSSDNFSHCELPEITIDDIKDNSDKMLFYTGLPDYGTYKALFVCLIQQGADKLVLDSSAMKTETDAKKGGVKRKLRIEDEFFMVLMRLRLGLLLKNLEYRFKISSGRISNQGSSKHGFS